MLRLLLVALGGWALTLAPPVQGVAQDVADFRERQRLTGRHIGCQLERFSALREQDLERVQAVERECGRLPPLPS